MVGIMPERHGLGDAQEMGQATHKNADVENLMGCTEVGQLSRDETLGGATCVEQRTDDIGGTHAKHVVQCDCLPCQSRLQVRKKWYRKFKGLNIRQKKDNSPWQRKSEV